MSSRDWVLLFVVLVVSVAVAYLVFYRAGLSRWVRGFRSPGWLRVLAVLEGAFLFFLLLCLVQWDAVQHRVPALLACGGLVVVGIICLIAFRAASANSIEH